MAQLDELFVRLADRDAAGATPSAYTVYEPASSSTVSVPGTLTRWKSSILSTNLIADVTMTTGPMTAMTKPIAMTMKYHRARGRTW